MTYVLKDFIGPDGKKYESVTFADYADYPTFLIEFVEIKEHRAEFVIHVVKSWADFGEPIDFETYISGSISWDGDAHLNFGNGYGYLNLDGRIDFGRHCMIMATIFDVCSKRIKHFNNEIAR